MKLASFALALSAVAATVASSGAQSLYEMQPGVQTRWASPENPTAARGAGARSNGGRKGSPTIAIPAGQSRVLAQETGTSGVVRRLWMTIPDRGPRMMRGLRIDMYWDGAATPAVSAPIGDFFGQGLGRMVTFESVFFSNPEGRSFNATIPMPFRTGMRIVMVNETGVDLPELFYDIDYTVGDRIPANALYFHAHYRRERNTRLQHDYEILPRITGRGRYLGVNIGVITDTATYHNTWWGEGEIKIYLDGDRELPTLAGTGTEDYVGTAWGQGAYSQMYQGSPIADDRAGMWAFYRYHVPDPVWFHRDIRVTMQQIGYLAPHSREAIVREGRPLYRAGPGRVRMDLSRDGKFERSDDWSSCAYFYLDRPGGVLGPIDPVAKRIEGL
ncbi:MAG TPA: glycoside hydrolase family 172 protein [Longimicrobium sp.]